MSTDRPNVVWISLEDTRPFFGCYGDEVARTPNIDALAERGVRYPNACSTAGVCAPSRSAVITGCYQTRLGGHHMKPSFDLPLLDDEDDPRPDDWDYPEPYTAVPPHYVRAFPEYLRSAGYYCTNNGKTHYQFQPDGWRTPETIWDRNDHGADDRNVDWRDRPDDNQPFFSVFNLEGTHEGAMRRDHETGTQGDLETDPEAVEVPPYLPDTPPVRNEIARHYDNLARSDGAVGELLAELDADGLREETYVFVWSDHGWGLPRCKRFLYEGGIDVPLIVAGPGIGSDDHGGDAIASEDDATASERNAEGTEGMIREAPISMVDLGPTVLELAGLDVPRWMDGEAFLGEGPDVREREYAIAARDRHDESYDMVRAVRSARYKYIRNYSPEKAPLGWVAYRADGAPMQELLRLYAAGELEPEQADLLEGGRPAEELYDLDEDPHEIDNLADDPAYRDVLLDHRDALADWRERTNDLGEESEYETVERVHGADVPETGEIRETAPPAFVPNYVGNREQRPVVGEVAIEDPATLLLQSSTQGAAIAYRIEERKSDTLDDEHPHWDRYDGRLRLDPGTWTVSAKAVRYGFRESAVRQLTLTVEG